ncbi:MAG TPA: glycosyltransferase family 9 protein [Candidatus Polarisedimenticolia bacterium]|nr:glycosyltransferase family 9 protein [Candidatus Polarisedimenticolia bacterium]
MKILLIRLSAVGDVVRTLPALTCLRRSFPTARIDWLVEEASTEIVQDQADLDHMLVFPRRRLSRVVLHPAEIPAAREALGRLAAQLKESKYDVVVDFQGTLKSALLARLTGAPRLVGLGRGHAREMSHIFYTEKVLPSRRKPGRVERALALAAHLGADVSHPASGIPEKEDDGAFADRFLASLPGGTRGRAPAVLFPGTSRTQMYKRYPTGHFGRLAELLTERTGSPVVVAWGPGELDLAEEVLAGSRGGAAVMAPAMTLGQLTALIRRSQVFVAGDTGPMHIAWTVGTPVVALYGPTDPEVNRPGGAFSTVAYDKVFCSPCRNRGCIARTCLEGLSPEKVADAAVDVMNRAAAAGWRPRPFASARVQVPADPPPLVLRADIMGPGARPPEAGR